MAHARLIEVSDSLSNLEVSGLLSTIDVHLIGVSFKRFHII